jgi:hypothetical protein
MTARKPMPQPVNLRAVAHTTPASVVLPRPRQTRYHLRQWMDGYGRRVHALGAGIRVLTALTASGAEIYSVLIVWGGVGLRCHGRPQGLPWPLAAQHDSTQRWRARRLAGNDASRSEPI